MAKQKGNKKGGRPMNSKGKKSQRNSAAGGDAPDGDTANRTKKKGRQRSNHQHSDDDDAEFRNTLLNQGNIVKEMSGDGNCLFRSLSDQLYHDSTGSKHDLVREDVCNFLSENKDEFMHFLLMGDDDEDVLDIDTYIDKMREDGEWGGNVEIVVASRVYKRNIMVFSSEYSNGVLSIVCNDENEEGGRSDLLLAYHGNDHYNSLHPIGGFRNTKQSTKLSGNSPVVAKHKKKKMHAHGGNTGNEKNCNGAPRLTTEGRPWPCGICHNAVSDDYDEAVAHEKVCAGNLVGNDNANFEEEENDHNNQSIVKGNKNRSRPPTRGSNCPCGSGQKYKKCCMAQEKAKKKLAAKQNREADDAAGAEDEKKEDTYIGEFKVLTI